MQVPTVPATFVTGDSSLLKMQQLAQCVAFLSNAQRVPMWHVYEYVHGSVVGIGASTWTSIPMATVVYDTDDVFDVNGTAAIYIRTQGYYSVEACVPFTSQASAFGCQVAFLWTAGFYNPHYAQGTQQRFGVRSGWNVGGGTDEVICAEDLVPVVCYPSDQISVQVWGGIACSVNVGGPVSGLDGRFTCNFTGRWVRTGS